MFDGANVKEGQARDDGLVLFALIALSLLGFVIFSARSGSCKPNLEYSLCALMLMYVFPLPAVIVGVVVGLRALWRWRVLPWWVRVLALTPGALGMSYFIHLFNR